MCVPLVTDETIENGEMIVDTSDNGIKITINDADGYLVSSNVYGFQNVSDEVDWTAPMKVQFHRLLNKGQVWPINLKMEWQKDASSMAGPTIIATGVGNLTKHEVKALLEVVAHDEYELAETKKSKYGIVDSYTFKAKPVIVEEDSYRPMELIEL